MDGWRRGEWRVERVGLVGRVVGFCWVGLVGFPVSRYIHLDFLSYGGKLAIQERYGLSFHLSIIHPQYIHNHHISAGLIYIALPVMLERRPKRT